MFRVMAALRMIAISIIESTFDKIDTSFTLQCNFHSFWEHVHVSDIESKTPSMHLWFI